MLKHTLLLSLGPFCGIIYTYAIKYYANEAKKNEAMFKNVVSL